MQRILTPRLTIDCVSNEARLLETAHAWDQLIDEREPGAVFQSSAWLVPWWEQFRRKNRLALYTARAGADLVGVLPAYQARGAWGGRVRLIGDGVIASDHLGLIASPEWRPVVADAIAARLLADGRDLVFESLEASDPLLRSLAERTARRRGSFGVLEERCPYIEIDPCASFAQWAAERRLGMSRRRKLARHRGFSLEVQREEGAILESLPALWQLHAAAWSGRGGSRAIVDETVIRFHEASARELARRGWARLFLLRIEGVPRAALYGFERGGRLCLYQAGADPEWRQRSVGTVLFGFAIEHAFESGLSEVDLLRGTEQYKLAVSTGQRREATAYVGSSVPARVEVWGATRAWPLAVQAVRMSRRLRGEARHLVPQERLSAGGLR